MSMYLYSRAGFPAELLDRSGAAASVIWRKFRRDGSEVVMRHSPGRGVRGGKHPPATCAVASDHSFLFQQEREQVAQLLAGHGLVEAVGHERGLRRRHLVHVLAGDAYLRQLRSAQVNGVGALAEDDALRLPALLRRHAVGAVVRRDGGAGVDDGFEQIAGRAETSDLR